MAAHPTKPHRTCSVEGCERSVRAREWCAMHYQRWYKRGTTDLEPRPKVCIRCGNTVYSKKLCRAHHYEYMKSLPVWPMSQKLIDRFWSRVKVVGRNDCWLWTAKLDVMGYGLFYIHTLRHQAHRVSWMIWHQKPIPDGLLGCHSCDNPTCVNPHHIFLGTTQENTADAAAKGRLVRKLEPHQVRAIRHKLSTTDLSMNAIAKQFSVSQQTIVKIAKRRTWRHV